MQQMTLQGLTLQQQLGQNQPAMMPQISPETTPPMMSVLTSPLNSVGGVRGGEGKECMGTINWAEWDEFMQDFDMENRPLGDHEFVMQDAKTSGLWF